MGSLQNSYTEFWPNAILGLGSLLHRCIIQEYGDNASAIGYFSPAPFDIPYLPIPLILLTGSSPHACSTKQ